SAPSSSSTSPPSMRGSRGTIHFPFTRTNVGRLVVEKKPSGRTPSAGAGANLASGYDAKAGPEKSGGGNVVTSGISPGSPERGNHKRGVQTRRAPRCSAGA